MPILIDPEPSKRMSREQLDKLAAYAATHSMSIDDAIVHLALGQLNSKKPKPKKVA